MQILSGILGYKDHLNELSITDLLISRYEDLFDIGSAYFTPKVSTIKTATIKWDSHKSSSYIKNLKENIDIDEDDVIKNSFRQILHLLKHAGVFDKLEAIKINLYQLMPFSQKYFKDEGITTIEIILI